MKILMVSPMPPQRQPTNAVPLVVDALIGDLRQRHTITLVTVVDIDPAEQNAVEDLVAIGVEVHVVHRNVSSSSKRWKRNARMAITWLTRPVPFRTIWFWEPAIQTILDDLLSSERFDLLLIDDNAMGMYAYKTSIPSIFTEHEVRRSHAWRWSTVFRLRHPSASLSEVDWQRWKKYHPSVWRRFDRVQVFTKRDYGAVQEVAPGLMDRVCVNPFGIFLPPLADPAREEERSIVFAGGFSHSPNVDAALWLCQDIMPRLRKLIPGVRLYLVGSFPPPQVQRLASDDVLVTGRVAEIEPYLERATVIVAPLRTGGGMRTKVLQGMAMGKAVVTTPRGVEGLADLGFQVPVVIAHNTEEFATRTADLLLDVNTRRTMGTNARAVVMEHFSAKAYALRLETIYEELRTTRQKTP